MRNILTVAAVAMLALAVCIACPADAAAQCSGGVCTLQPSLSAAAPTTLIHESGFQAYHRPSNSRAVAYGSPVVATYHNSCPFSYSPVMHRRSAGIAMPSRQYAHRQCRDSPATCYQRSVGITFHPNRLIR